MVSEEMLQSILAAAGFLLLRSSATFVSRPLAALLSVPLGHIVVVGTSLLLLLANRYSPALALALTVVTAVSAALLWPRRRTVRGTLLDLAWCAGLVAAVIGSAAVLTSLRIAPMTNDSFWLMRAAAALVEAGLHAPPDFLVLRSFPLFPSLVQALSWTTAGDYLVAPTPLFNLLGIAALLWLLKDELALRTSQGVANAVALAVGAVLLSTFQIAFQSFYIRGNAEFGVVVALYAALTYRGHRLHQWDWWLLALPFLFAALLLRVESPLFLLPFIVIQGTAMRVPWRVRFAVVSSFSALVAVVYGLFLLTGEGSILSTASIAVFLVGTGAALALTVLTRNRRLASSPLLANLGSAMVLGLAAVALLLTMARPGWMLESGMNMLRNMGDPTIGLWGVTWFAVALALIFGRSRTHLEFASIFAVPLLCNALFIYIFAFFTRVPYEAKWAASPNRLLTSLLVPGLYFLTMRILQPPEWPTRKWGTTASGASPRWTFRRTRKAPQSEPLQQSADVGTD